MAGEQAAQGADLPPLLGEAVGVRGQEGGPRAERVAADPGLLVEVSDPQLRGAERRGVDLVHHPVTGAGQVGERRTADHDRRQREQRDDHKAHQEGPPQRPAPGQSCCHGAGAGGRDHLGAGARPGPRRRGTGARPGLSQPGACPRPGDGQLVARVLLEVSQLSAGVRVDPSQPGAGVRADPSQPGAGVRVDPSQPGAGTGRRRGAGIRPGPAGRGQPGLAGVGAARNRGGVGPAGHPSTRDENPSASTARSSSRSPPLSSRTWPTSHPRRCSSRCLRSGGRMTRVLPRNA